MHTVIDTPWDSTDHLAELRDRGVRTIIRYYNHNNSSKLPEKRVEKSEADAIAAAGLNLAVVFQQRGGAGGKIADLDKESGERDAKRALDLANKIGQPKGSAIYFAVDHDYWKAADLEKIKPYFKAVHDKLRNKYRVGIYGSGTLGRVMSAAGHVDLIWLAAAKGWSGTKEMLKTDQWALYQIWPPINDPLPHDGNLVSAAWHDYGQFTPGGPDKLLPGGVDGATGTAIVTEADEAAPNTVIMEVVARSGLKLRRGPSENYGVETSLAHGTHVFALGRSGAWIQVDIQGDGHADGFMHGSFLSLVSGGLRDDHHSPAITPDNLTSPYAFARAELVRGVKEISGSTHNPRVVMYHNSTTASAGTADEVAWCSSFTNWCVEQAGRTGTNSQWALSWEHWGQDVSDAPREGDIVVWERVGKGGHVGFFVEDLGSHISVLGGNQSDRVRISSYPKDGPLGNFTYKLRAIRRG